MRQGQQHRRGRGRNNGGGGGNGHHHQNQNNRKGQNPLTRSFESNGPDVKLRGNPAHIAEKYMALARDATSAGDPVLAENYLQHAEHYNRIILAYREQQGFDAAQNGGMRQPTGDPSVDGEFSDEEGASGEMSADGGAGSQPMVRPEGQPSGGFEGQQRFEDRPPREHNNGQRHHNNQHRHNNYRDRNDGGERRFNNDRGEYRNNDNRRDRDQGFRQEARERFDRFDRNQDRNSDNSGRGEMDQRPQRFERNDAPPPVASADAGQEPRRRDNRPSAAAPVPSDEQPAFLRRPVRRPRRETAEGSGDEPSQE